MSLVRAAVFAAGAGLVLCSQLLRARGAAKKSDRRRALCVFCGSRTPAGEAGEKIVAEAKALGQWMVENNVDLVYGGGSVGVMGIIAKAVDVGGGNVYGIIPRTLAPREAAGATVQPENAVFVDTMHQRKAIMAERCDAFIALPGGFGTFEELLEMITWTQLGIHRKSVGVLNCVGFYDHLLAFFQNAVDSGFIPAKSLAIVKADTSAAALAEAVLAHEPPKGYFTWPKVGLQ